MFSFFQKKQYKTLNTIYIHKEALLNNFGALQTAHPEAAICPVLKSNAYGHGIQIVAEIFDTVRPAFLVVDSLYEAYELHKNGITSQILIMGYTDPVNFSIKRLPFSYAVYDVAVARALDKYQPGASIHIFVDTGMCREGVPVSELKKFVHELKKLDNLKIDGLTSHFADADNPTDQAFTALQLKKFKEAVQILESENILVKWKHIAASAGAYKISDPIFTMIRVGLASYGITPLEPLDASYKKIKLQPALSFYSTLVQIKTISAGSKVGYNGTYTASDTTKIGLLPAGYYEGVDRRLSNSGYVKIGDILCPIIGRVSMNMTAIDISHVTDSQVGDRVCIYSEKQEDKNNITTAAKLAKTIPYELLVHLAETVKREVL